MTPCAPAPAPLAAGAALALAACFVTGFAVFAPVLAPLGYGSTTPDAAAILSLLTGHPLTMTLWSLAVYMGSGAALAVLAPALARPSADLAPELSALSVSAGTIWAGLLIAAGLVSSVAIAVAATPDGPDLWPALHMVEIALGGQVELPGALWLGLVNAAALRAGTLAPMLARLGLVAAAAGVMTLVPPLAELAGAVFGLAMLGWLVWLGCALGSVHRAAN